MRNWFGLLRSLIHYSWLSLVGYITLGCGLQPLGCINTVLEIIGVGVNGVLAGRIGVLQWESLGFKIDAAEILLEIVM